MPVYEFFCKICENKFEDFVKMNTKELKCPKCGKISKKIISNSTFILKGSGWYIDGYSKEKKRLEPRMKYQKIIKHLWKG